MSEELGEGRKAEGEEEESDAEAERGRVMRAGAVG